MIVQLVDLSIKGRMRRPVSQIVAGHGIFM
jgi:hypothetical protein